MYVFVTLHTCENYHLAFKSCNLNLYINNQNVIMVWNLSWNLKLPALRDILASCSKTSLVNTSNKISVGC